jgi:hypothetical protein
MKTTTTTDLATLTNFAAAVLASIARIDESSPLRFNRKVFIAALEPSKTTKRLLVEAHRAGLLVLSRCDLSQAFSREIQDLSLTTYMNAEFHFIAPVPAKS